MTVVREAMVVVVEADVGVVCDLRIGGAGLGGAALVFARAECTGCTVRWWSGKGVVGAGALEIAHDYVVVKMWMLVWRKLTSLRGPSRWLVVVVGGLKVFVLVLEMVVMVVMAVVVEVDVVL